MTIYADLDENNVVINVIVADQEFIDGLPNSAEYVLLTDGGIGWTYDSATGNFISPQPFPSWTLDSNNVWQAPTPKPDGNYNWNEDTQTWQISVRP